MTERSDAPQGEAEWFEWRAAHKDEPPYEIWMAAWKAARSKTAASAPSAVPCVVVPLEPTEAMLHALYMDGCSIDLEYGPPRAFNALRKGYAAMLAAAPSERSKP